MSARRLIWVVDCMRGGSIIRRSWISLFVRRGYKRLQNKRRIGEGGIKCGIFNTYSALCFWKGWEFALLWKGFSIVSLRWAHILQQQNGPWETFRYEGFQLQGQTSYFASTEEGKKEQQKFLQSIIEHILVGTYFLKYLNCEWMPNHLPVHELIAYVDSRWSARGNEAHLQHPVA